MIRVIFLQSCVLFYFLPDAIIMIFFFWAEFAWIFKPQFMQSCSTVQYLRGHKNRLMLPILSVFAFKKEGILKGYLSEIWSESPWLYSPLCITFSRATVFFFQGILHIHSLCLKPVFIHNQLSECTLHCNISAAQTVLHHCNRNLS